MCTRLLLRLRTPGRDSLVTSQAARVARGRPPQTYRYPRRGKRRMRSIAHVASMASPFHVAFHVAAVETRPRDWHRIDSVRRYGSSDLPVGKKGWSSVISKHCS